MPAVVVGTDDVVVVSENCSADWTTVMNAVTITADGKVLNDVALVGDGLAVANWTTSVELVKIAVVVEKVVSELNVVLSVPIVDVVDPELGVGLETVMVTTNADWLESNVEVVAAVSKEVAVLEAELSLIDEVEAEVEGVLESSGQTTWGTGSGP